MLNPQTGKQKGIAATLTVIIIMTIALLIAFGVSALIFNSRKISRNSLKSAQAYFLAEAGAEDSIYRIIRGKHYEANNSFSTSAGGFEASITTEGGSRIVMSKGVVSSLVRKVKVTLATNSTDVAFHYGAQVDKGGLQIQPNAKINGNVYSNGNITGVDVNSNAMITGDAWVAGGEQASPNQQWLTQNADFAFGLKSGSTYYLDTVQSFVPNESKPLSKVSFYIKKAGNPPDQAVRIVSDDSGKPSRTSLAGGTLQSAKVTSSYGWIDVSLDTQPNLIAGQTYWILIDVSQDNDNYWIWGRDSSGGYASGTGKYTNDWTKNNAVWTNVGGDLDFKAWLGGVITEISNIKVNVDAHAHKITNSIIGGGAFYQNIDSQTRVSGLACPNANCYPDTPDPPAEDLPISYAQIQEWEQAAASGGIETPTGGTYYPMDGATLGPKKIEGNLSFPLDGTVTITGPIWVTGKIYAANNVTIKLPDGLTDGYAVIADDPSDQTNNGKIEFSNNVITQDSSGGGYLLFISTNKSQNVDNPAILLSNNINAVTAQSIIFSLSGLIKVENNAKFKEITGYGIYLANNAEIVYDIGLIHAGFSSGPGAGWSVGSWQEIQ